MTIPESHRATQGNHSGEIGSIVPDKSHYGAKYILDGRMFSYAHQIEAVLAFSPKRVLEVGPGPGIVTYALRNSGIEVLTLDVESSNKPDLLGSVTNIPLGDHMVDIVLCCQVLEHLPFDHFLPALHELRRVASIGSVISLPDITPYYYIQVALPLFHRHSIAFSRSLLNPPVSVPGNGFEQHGHYWEIGVKGSQINDVRDAICKGGWHILREKRVDQLSWHHFFILEMATTVRTSD
jgi:hypothetical protein